MDLSGLVGTVGLVALVWKFIDFLRNVTSWSDPAARKNVITQVCAWVAGLAAVLLYGESQLGESVTVGTKTLEDADTATKIIIGLMVASLASATVDIKKAIDGSDSAKQPPLLP